MGLDWYHTTAMEPVRKPQLILKPFRMEKPEPRKRHPLAKAPAVAKARCLCGLCVRDFSELER